MATTTMKMDADITVETTCAVAIATREHSAGRTEEQLRRTLGEESRRRAELQDFMESAVEPMHSVDAQGVIVWANQAELTLLGYTKEEYVGHPIAEFHADANAIAVIHDPHARNQELHEFEARLRAKDGSIRTVLINSGVFHRGGEFIHTRCRIRDITERRRAEDERRVLLLAEQAARSKAEIANKAKDDFLAILSHELRTPLNSMLGWTQVLQSGTLTSEEQTHALSVIERNARAQARLLDELFDMSRIISGKLAIEAKPLDLTSALRLAVDSATPQAVAKEITLTLHATSGIRVYGDMNRLQQIFNNLLTNALKFTPRKGTVVVRVECGHGVCRTSVTDSGPGVPAEFLPHIFERFQQASTSMPQGTRGLGLGLSIVRELVQLHGGSVRVANVDPGAQFTVVLPLYPDTIGADDSDKSA